MISSYLFLNDLRFHYLHWNLKGDGRPIVLLHGLASNARIWELVAPLLAKSGSPVLALDQRGHGLTDKPDGDYGFDTYLRDLAGFIDGMGLERPLLIGHSWGAMVTLDYAARRSFGPQAPAGLVLVDGGMTQMDAAPGATWEGVRQRLTPPSLAGMPVETFLEHLRDPRRRWQPDEQAQAIILANFLISEGDGDGPDGTQETITPHLSLTHHMQILRAMWEFKTYQRFQQVRCPVMMVPAKQGWADSQVERDYLVFKEQGVAIAQQTISDLEVHWLEDTVHDIPLQRPAELGRLISCFAARLDNNPV